MAYENIIVETRGKVGLIRLNRPQALNALSRALMADLRHALDAFEADPNISCVVITGLRTVAVRSQSAAKSPR